MKKVILSLLGAAALVGLTACQTQTASEPSYTGSAASGQKCSQCDCKAYAQGRILKDVCKHCGHTAAEHSAAAQ